MAVGEHLPFSDAMFDVFVAVLKLQAITLDLPDEEQARLPHMMAQLDAYGALARRLADLAGVVLGDDFSAFADTLEADLERAKAAALPAPAST